ncbi:hypothetical protein [Microbacterium gallinarum]|uniref:Uncharacterized protein n=1 Tax=Microbacterium gallinarum TaxID=2762209 RepID=A0ABR8X294_9MICO|nr:hypothetical protein [Microbacterium gallinarum]MBD8023459.1 hypothetical protein [Microbacterium gallinarum]
MPDALTTRDEAQRRMFVALAESAPLVRRRPRSIAGLAVFALAGVLAGAATSAAVALSDDSRAGSVTHLPPSVDQIAATVPGDTQLLGDPFLVEHAIGPMTLEVGTAPEGATELFVAFRCLGAGVEVISLNGRAISTNYCEGTGGGSGGGEPITGQGPHRVSVSGSGSYMLWVSWSAPVEPPAASPEQSAAVADGDVTDAEYRAGFERYATCMADGGHPVDVIDATQRVISYVTSGASVQSGIEGRCYALEFALIDEAWQSSRP